jgi:hypothetical protein
MSGSTGLGRVRKWIVRSAIVAAFFYTPIASVNPASRLALVESLSVRGTPETSQSRFFNRVDMVESDGRFYSDKPPLLALYSTAVVAPLQALLGFDGIGGKIVYWWIVASASGLALLSLVISIRKLAGRERATVSWRWLVVGVIGATCVLPFARTYDDHILEAAALLGVLVLLRDRSEARIAWRPVLVGLLVGITWLLHPLVGTVTVFTTGGYYLLARRTMIGTSRLMAIILFAIGSLGTVGVGTAVHQAMYGRPLPFYFSPELYLWTDGPGGVQSHWLEEPSVPGLTEDRITARFEKLGIGEPQLEETLEAFRAYEAGVSDPLAFAARRYLRYGSLSFDSLVLFCGFLLVAGAFRGQMSHRPEALWVLASAIGLFAAGTALRAVPGGSFGDRHLLPVLPLIVCAGGLSVSSAREKWLFCGLALLSLTMMFPGAIAPWVTPGDPFLWINLGLTVLAVTVAVLVRRSRTDPFLQRLDQRYSAPATHRGVVLAVGGMLIGQVLLYLGTLPTA